MNLLFFFHFQIIELTNLNRFKKCFLFSCFRASFFGVVFTGRTAFIHPVNKANSSFTRWNVLNKKKIKNTNYIMEVMKE